MRAGIIDFNSSTHISSSIMTTDFAGFLHRNQLTPVLFGGKYLSGTGYEFHEIAFDGPIQQTVLSFCASIEKTIRDKKLDALVFLDCDGSIIHAISETELKHIGIPTVFCFGDTMSREKSALFKIRKYFFKNPNLRGCSFQFLFSQTRIVPHFKSLLPVINWEDRWPETTSKKDAGDNRITIGIPGELFGNRIMDIDIFLHNLRQCHTEHPLHIDIFVAAMAEQDRINCRILARKYRDMDISFTMDALSKEEYKQRVADCDVIASLSQPRHGLCQFSSLDTSATYIDAIRAGKPILQSIWANSSMHDIFQNGVLLYNDPKHDVPLLDAFFNDFGKDKEKYAKKGQEAIVYMKEFRSDKAFLDLLKPISKEENNKLIIPNLETHIIDSCNLNCNGCSHYANLNTWNGKDGLVTPEQLDKDLAQITEHAEIQSLLLYGGEPTLNPYLPEIIRTVRARLPETDIGILSNGLLLPTMPQDFWNAMHETRTSLCLTHYQPFDKSVDTVGDLVRKNRIRYSHGEPAANAFFRSIVPTGGQDKEKVFSKCGMPFCYTLYKGKIYGCVKEPYVDKFAKKFGYQKMYEAWQKCGYSIYDKNMDWKWLVEEMPSHPRAMCEFCAEYVVNKPWRAHEKPQVSDWAVDMNSKEYKLAEEADVHSL